MFSEDNLIAPFYEPILNKQLIIHGIKEDDYALNIVYDSEGNILESMLQVNEDVIVYGRKKEKDNSSSALDK